MSLINMELPKQAQRLYNLFKSGRCFSVADITIILGQCDPRGHIRELRNRGVSIADKWVTTDDGHYKLYWLEE